MTKTTKPEPSYKSHIPGSRKGSVHECFDKRGADAATELGLKLKLKHGTLKSWMGAWKRSKPSTEATAPKAKVTKGSAPKGKSGASPESPANGGE